jgi:hypothetical protein
MVHRLRQGCSRFDLKTYGAEVLAATLVGDAHRQDFKER